MFIIHFFGHPAANQNEGFSQTLVQAPDNHCLILSCRRYIEKHGLKEEDGQWTQLATSRRWKLLVLEMRSCLIWMVIFIFCKTGSGGEKLVLSFADISIEYSEHVYIHETVIYACV